MRSLARVCSHKLMILRSQWWAMSAVQSYLIRARMKSPHSEDRQTVTPSVIARSLLREVTHWWNTRLAWQYETILGKSLLLMVICTQCFLYIRKVNGSLVGFNSQMLLTRILFIKPNPNEAASTVRTIEFAITHREMFVQWLWNLPQLCIKLVHVAVYFFL